MRRLIAVNQFLASAISINVHLVSLLFGAITTNNSINVAPSGLNLRIACAGPLLMRYN